MYSCSVKKNESITIKNTGQMRMYSIKNLSKEIRKKADEIYDSKEVCKISMTKNLGKYHLIYYKWNGTNEIITLKEDDYKYLIHDYFPKIRGNQPILISQEYIISTESLPIN